MSFFLKIILFIIISRPLIACEKFNKFDSIESWLGNNSEFSISYKKGKCALDKALIDLPIEQRRVIANLIAKSYTRSLKNFKESSAYY